MKARTLGVETFPTRSRAVFRDFLDFLVPITEFYIVQIQNQ